jgi:hypothetical protein
MKSGIIGHSSKGRAEVRSFWEEWLGDINKPTERSNQEP